MMEEYNQSLKSKILGQPRMKIQIDIFKKQENMVYDNR